MDDHSSVNCLTAIEYSSLQNDNIHLIFENNNASFGSAIYIQSNLSQCSWTGEVDTHFDISYFPNWPIFDLQ